MALCFILKDVIGVGDGGNAKTLINLLKNNFVVSFVFLYLKWLLPVQGKPNI